ncbi:uncharacterized protein MONOS_5712 [Monocercomonoides exilis]|uniref:uncharacterized protein n=1 Tax=Monocercomonoides exilis TaxID=2049356 RepID=UPI00355AB6AA|nr:hypothetical protein MONOS_5712 [Monocercomonoides exilis]|eukprot:MONOS_5712.1-p1 / transcript=MONOS_5712.1 / gene=MONOS_5712 / organism=Monocercomonoides_exilis_PA203 / gene_product=unspecified product / transcript_product=unspecified product / location=Mono_scaffold00170:2273-2506(+) / protein_length=78 / sequence_SO=supercontig / SO=protein_coding / is_pseudo=false
MSQWENERFKGVFVSDKFTHIEIEGTTSRYTLSVMKEKPAARFREGIQLKGAEEMSEVKREKEEWMNCGEKRSRGKD